MNPELIKSASFMAGVGAGIGRAASAVGSGLGSAARATAQGIAKPIVAARQNFGLWRSGRRLAQAEAGLESTLRSLKDVSPADVGHTMSNRPAPTRWGRRLAIGAVAVPTAIAGMGAYGAAKANTQLDRQQQMVQPQAMAPGY